MPPFHLSAHRAFSIIEFLLVIGMLGIIAAVVIVAINPAKHLQSVRNATRHTEVREITNAIQQYSIRTGSFPPGIDSTLRMIGTSVTGCDVSCMHGEETPATCIDLSQLLVNEYLIAMPVDPLQGSSGQTFYAVRQLPTHKVHVRACAAEGGEMIEKEL